MAKRKLTAVELRMLTYVNGNVTKKEMRGIREDLEKGVRRRLTKPIEENQVAICVEARDIPIYR